MQGPCRNSLPTQIKLLRDLDPDHVLTFNRSVMCQASSPGSASLTVVYSRNDLHLVESSWESVSATLISPELNTLNRIYVHATTSPVNPAGPTHRRTLHYPYTGNPKHPLIAQLPLEACKPYSRSQKVGTSLSSCAQGKE